MSTVLHMVALNHLLMGQPRAVIADTTSLDGLEEGVAILILLLNELGIVVEFIKGRRDAQQRCVGQFQDGHDGFVEEIEGDVSGFIDDDDISTSTTGCLGRWK
jgi:hypothetical protein